MLIVSQCPTQQLWVIGSEFYWPTCAFTALFIFIFINIMVSYTSCPPFRLTPARCKYHL